MQPLFFSIHSINALESREFSVIRANIENTPEKVELAKSIYSADKYHFQFHDYKLDMRPVI